MAVLFDVASVNDAGEYYSVESVEKLDSVFTSSPGKQYINISALAAEIIKKNLEQGYLVYFRKDLNRECTPMDIIVHKGDDLETAKNKAISRIYAKMHGIMASLSILDIYSYISSFCRFASHGIFITDENVDKVKEIYSFDQEKMQKLNSEIDPDNMVQNTDDAYIRIIEKRNEESIKYLRDFIDSSEKIKDVWSKYKELEDVISQINAAETAEEATNIADNFIGQKCGSVQ